MLDVVEMLTGEPARHRIKLQLWFEDLAGEGFGSGRIALLLRVDELGSLSKAAKELGMSYRAAWGKIKKAEHILGTPLVESSGAKRDGYRLTSTGKMLVAAFTQWFADVECFARQRAACYFPLQDNPPGIERL